MAKSVKNILNRLQKKYINVTKQIKNTGIKTFVIAKIYEHFTGIQFKIMGVSYYNTDDNIVPFSAYKDAHENQASPFYSLKEGFKAIPLAYNEISLLDIGCGNGRVLNFAMFLKFMHVAGIDLNNAALKKAVSNCSKIYQKGYTTEFNIQNADAVYYTIPSSTNVIYLFNPFGSQTMEKVAANIVSYAHQSGKNIYVIYLIPSFQHFFEAFKECKKVYESFDKNKTHAELSVFRITPGSN